MTTGKSKGASGGAPGKKLLVVDDEPSFGDLVARIAQRQGILTQIARTGKDFQKQFKKLKPDICVIDIVMPELDGFELVDWLGVQDHTCPLIFVTGRRPEYIRQAATLAKTAGLTVAGTLEKPLSADALVDAINSCGDAKLA